MSGLGVTGGGGGSAGSATGARGASGRRCERVASILRVCSSPSTPPGTRRPARDRSPASLSPAAIDGLLRAEFGFGGVVITDALGMNAVSDRWDNAEAARLAITAGADLVVLDDPSLVTPVLDALEAAVTDGTLDPAHVRASVERVLALKATDPCELVTG